MKKQFIINLLRIYLVLIVVILGSSRLLAQDGTTIVGRVSDEKGELLIGVTVIEKGTSNGVITDINGQYTLKNVTSKDAILTFSFISYISQDVKVGSSKVIDVVLKENVEVLNEVVVVGYGQQRKISVVGSQSTLRGADAKMPVGNLSSAIAGRMPGVVAVQRSGEPGHDGSQIYIRGLATFVGQSSHPLILVDGIERSFNNLDPDDIESFTILKDASATAVYGVRGANGVVIITTKPGKIGKPEFSVDYYEGFTTMTRRIKMADGFQYMDAANEAHMTTNGRPYYTPQYIEATKKAYGLLPNDNPELYNPYLYPNVDWTKSLFNEWGHNRRVNTNVSGGSPNVNYYVSLSYYGETGLTKKFKMQEYDTGIQFDRYNFMTNLNIRPTSSTQIDVGAGGYISEGNYPEVSTNDLYTSAMDMNPVYMPLMMPDGSVSGRRQSGDNDKYNPYASLARRGYKNEYRSTINTNLKLSQDLGFWNWSEGLKLNGLIAFDNYTGRDLYYSKRESSFYYDAKIDPETGLWENDILNSDGTYKMTRTYQGHDELQLGGGTDSNRSFYLESSLNYEKIFGDHRVSGLFVYNQKTYRNTTADNLRYTLAYKTQGIALRATYSWMDRYFAEFNLGYNGSENFSPGKRFGTFPAFGVGYVISNEKFWSPLSKYITHLKFRYTDGKVGSDAVGDRRFMYLAEMGGNEGYRFGTGYGYHGGWGISKYGVNVGWSTSRKQDLGMDVSFLSNSLNFTVDLFKERRKDIFLRRATVPSYTGWTEMPYANLGVIDNKGIEFAVDWNIKLAENSLLTVRGNLTWNEDKIVENDEPEQRYSWKEKRGTNVNATWGYIAEGLFTDEDDIENMAKPAGAGNVQVGDIKYRDINGDGVIDDDDVVRIGQGNLPKIYYGFGADYQIGNFSIGAILQGQAKVTTLMNGSSIRPFSSQSGLDNLFANIDDRWSEKDPNNQNVFYPRLHWGSADNNNNNKPSTWWLRNMDYLRLKQLTVTYNIPRKWSEKVRLKNAKIYLMGSNLLTFSKFKLWDPELDTSNGASYPNLKTYSIGVNINF